MVKKSRSMERTIKEGNDFLQRMNQRERLRAGNANKNQKDTQKKQRAEPKKVVQQKQVAIKKVKQQRQQKQKESPAKKQQNTQSKISTSSQKIEKKIPLKQTKATPQKREQKVEVKQKEIKKIEIEKEIEKPKAKQIPKPEPQPKQVPRKTKSNISDISDVNKPSVGMVDCVFVVDTTGSMDPYLERTTHTVEMLVERIKTQSKNEQVSVRFGLVCYRDHPPQEQTYVTEIHDLCSNKEILEAIQKADCYGGGDGAEAALDGLNAAAQQITWRDSSKIPSLRYIFHICDQPPHGKEFGGYSELWDEGCPCGLKPDQVIHRINMRQIHYRLIKANPTRLDLFAKHFQASIVNYDEVTLEDGVAEGMEIKISDMVIRELCPDILYD